MKENVFKSLSKPAPVMPPTYVLFAILLMVLLKLTLPIPGLLPAAWNLLGNPLLVSGITISTLAEKRFHKVKTTIKPFQEATTLVTDGFFRFSRNPMYLGFTIALVGVGILLNSLASLLIVPLFMVLLQLKFIRVEERMMAESFTSEWQSYARKTRRWI